MSILDEPDFTEMTEFKKWRRAELDRLHEEKEENETKQRILDAALAELKLGAKNEKSI